MNHIKKLLGIFLTSVTAIAVATIAIFASPTKSLALTRAGNNQYLTCGEYQTNLDWNISREEIAGLESYNEQNMKTTSEILAGVTYEGYCQRDTTYNSIRIGAKTQGSITFTLTKKVSAIGFYACAYQNNNDTGKSLLVNDNELTKTLPAAQQYEYSDTLRFFYELSEDTNIITIKAKEVSNNRFHLFSVGFYSKNNFPNVSNGGLENPETNTITILPSDLIGVDPAAAIDQTIKGVKIEISNGLINSSQIRVYKNRTLKLTLTGMKEIEFTCTAEDSNQYGPGCFSTASGYTYSSYIGRWTGDASSVTFTASLNQVRITQIIISL